MFKSCKKYGKLSDRDLGVFTLGLSIGCLVTLLVAMVIMNYVFKLVLPGIAS